MLVFWRADVLCSRRTGAEAKGKRGSCPCRQQYWSGHRHLHRAEATEQDNHRPRRGDSAMGGRNGGRWMGWNEME
jgi:hypothetical protein